MPDSKLHIELRTSPHLKQTVSTAQIMRNVVYALLPVSAFAVFAFGISVLALLAVTTLACVLTEALSCRLSGRAATLGDWSAVITGLLLGLTLPPGFPLWMAAVAGFIAIGLGKALFGGLGHNVMNPALVGRAFVQAAFPVAITTWTPAFLSGRFGEFIPTTLTLPFMQPPAIGAWIAAGSADAFTGATPLALQKFEQITTGVTEMLTGMTAGSAGETAGAGGGTNAGITGDQNVTVVIGDNNQSGAGDGSYNPVLEYATDMATTRPVIGEGGSYAPSETVDDRDTVGLGEVF